MRIDLTQQSSEWRVWRDAGIGASDAATIMYLNPYQSAYNLWAIKTKRLPAPARNARMQRGIDLEAEARRVYIAQTGNLIEPACFVHDRYDWMRASLDGWVDQLVVEIKNPLDLRDHLMAREGQVPDYYWCQVQHQLAVADAPAGHYFSYFKRDQAGEHSGEGVLVEVAPDRDFIAAMIEIEADFWRRVQNNEWPLPEGEAVRDDAEFVEMARRHQDYLRMAEEAERLKQRSLSELMRTCRDKRITRGGGLKLEWVHRDGYTEKKPRTVNETVYFKVTRI